MTRSLTAMQKFEADCNAQREKMYGPNWRDLNWYGQPLAPVYQKRIARVPGSKWAVNEHSTMDKIGQGV